VEAPGVTRRSAYAGSVRSSSVRGGSIPSSANHAVSTLTQTLAESIGTRRSPPSGRTYSSGGATEGVTSAKAPSPSGREAKVLSMPKAASAIGLSAVRLSLVARVPASPAARTSRV
jgi:hypothetical protein